MPKVHHLLENTAGYAGAAVVGLDKVELSSTLSISRRVTSGFAEAAKECAWDSHEMLFGTRGEKIHRIPKLSANHRNRIRERGLGLQIPGGAAHRERAATRQSMSQQGDDRKQAQ
jgi:hypothetical protein